MNPAQTKDQRFFAIGKLADFRPPIWADIKRVEAEQHRKRDQDFVSRKIFFTDEKFTDPGDLHDRRPESGKRSEKVPAPVERDEDKSGVEDRDITEKPERIVLAGGNQNRGEKSA